MKKFLKTALVLGVTAVTALAGGVSLPYKGYNTAICVQTISASAPKSESEKAIEAAAAETAAPGAIKEDALKITAKAAFLMEANSGKVLFSKDENKQLPIASMVKIGTLAVIYDALESGQIKMTDEVMISKIASGMGGSQAFLDFDSTYKVEDLIKSIVVASANDACVAMAELIAGNEADFVVKMNELAARLGMANTNYVNCTGLPAAGAYSCAADVAKMYAYIMKSPFYGSFNKIWMYDLTHPSGRVTGLTNTNKHARFFEGCEGGKTGYTAEAGHCISVTATRKNLRPVAVIIGAADSKTRFAESAALMNNVFNNYENRQIIDSAKPLSTVRVKGSSAENTELFARESYYELLKKGDKNAPAVNVEMPKTVKAPVGRNQAVGKIIVTEDGKVLKEIDIVTGSDIKGLSYWGAVKKIARKFKLRGS
jgi:D-alanyl-D-alanine carboxypeptidase (penicillin-binding protein 5/6)